MYKQTRAVYVLSKIGYIIGCLILYIFSIWIIGAAVYSIFFEVFQSTFTVYKILDEIALVIFAIAVVDVAKYLTLEEVIRSDPDEARPPREEREIFTKFVTIISTALALEGLVLTIEVAKTDLEKIVYPVLLLITAAIFIISIGIYQRLSVSSDRAR